MKHNAKHAAAMDPFCSVKAAMSARLANITLRSCTIFVVLEAISSFIPQLVRLFARPRAHLSRGHETLGAPDLPYDAIRLTEGCGLDAMRSGLINIGWNDRWGAIVLRFKYMVRPGAASAHFLLRPRAASACSAIHFTDLRHVFCTLRASIRAL